MPTSRAFGRFLSLLAWLAGSATALAQGPAGYNYDETKVPAYTLPDPLLCADGTRVKSAAEWKDKRRPELLRMFAEWEYGRNPEKQVAIAKTVVREVNPQAANGKARCREIDVWFTDRVDGPKMTILLFTPLSRTKAPASWD